MYLTLQQQIIFYQAILDMNLKILFKESDNGERRAEMQRASHKWHREHITNDIMCHRELRKNIKILCKKIYHTPVRKESNIKKRSNTTKIVKSCPIYRLMHRTYELFYSIYSNNISKKRCIVFICYFSFFISGYFLYYGYVFYMFLYLWLLYCLLIGIVIIDGDMLED